MALEPLLIISEKSQKIQKLSEVKCFSSSSLEIDTNSEYTNLLVLLTFPFVFGSVLLGIAYEEIGREQGDS